ncbi:Probable nucleoredoxin 1 [Seminavis robusta]|uniref:Probable nucleoredoxin 1 n=1 Tax=Seminavis robusta TaxID=568900 RepID=A0A9N8DFY1_9STRA|nr:Probable nucleoredoxin 1 [Seminavis robusta]|eukprot:Sro49_g028680.1 Probable nucleoredoxin 1 (348) ;mRNA; r:79254-80428
MRLSFILLLSALALTLAQEAVVEEAEAAAVETEELDLDALIEDANEFLATENNEAVEEEPASAASAATEDIPAAQETVNAEEIQGDQEETVDATTTATTADEQQGDTTTETAESSEAEATESATAEASAAEETAAKEEEPQKLPEQAGPFIDLLGPQLYSLQMIDERQAQLTPQLTNEALKGKKVIGLYFSADWCGPCRKFTPELVAFYEKMNKKRRDDFEIVWVSRCRDMQSYGQYFTHMKWLALPFEEAAGQRGQWLSQKYGVKGIPSFVLLDDLGNVITTDARNKIPQDKAGIGFPWGNPFSTLLKTVVPRSLRLMVKTQVDTLKGKLVQQVKGLVGMSKTKTA